MAKYNVTYTCGHTCEINLYGKIKDRLEKIEWMEANQICPECYKAQKEAEAKAYAEENGLPELTGTPKQIAWAESIRADFAAKKGIFATVLGTDSIVAALLNAELADKVQFETPEEAAKLAIEYILKNNTSAKWWIDVRQNVAFQGQALVAWAKSLC